MNSLGAALVATTDPTVTAEIVATLALGPTNNLRDPPNTTYPSSASGTAYSPYWTGTPAITA